ncbi:Alpha/beta hydrolase fold protein [metagenome]|uniref:Alpha/beta hydrolase fold protein n=1 Tax=metagenome TaxID=256318 RepID=A0A2P2C887_9ZZZZ
MTQPVTDAREPDSVGFAERDGVRLAWRSYGTGGPPLLLLPTWQIIDSRFWKAQVAHLSRHHRVVTYDGRGTGASSRPAGSASYTTAECAEDVIAVMDATGLDAAVLVGLSCGVAWAVTAAAEHPDRVLGVVAIGPSCNLDVVQRVREQIVFDAEVDQPRGWGMYNRDFWLDGGFTRFREFFFDTMCNEPHSTKQLEDLLDWSADTDPQMLVEATFGRIGGDGVVCTPLDAVCPQVRCPVLVIHGTDDLIADPSIGNRLAELTGGSLLLLEGSGHAPLTRDPVRVNLAITDFVTSLAPPVRRRTHRRAGSRRPRALYLSSPIGLGHARRDLAIGRELRRLHPDLQIDWLTQDPVTRMLDDAGETVHPGSAWLASESTHIEHESGEHDLHAFEAIRRMDAILVNNFHVFHDAVEEQHYDLVIGDEAWDVDYYLHENPELKRFAFAWLTDFVGWLPMPDGGAREARLTADYNAEMIEQRARFGRVRDASVFVGTADDVVDSSFGPGLPDIRDWTSDNFDFSGYVTGSPAVGAEERAALRQRLGYRDDQRVCLVTVGGSGVGTALLERVLEAVPVVRRSAPDLHFEFVTGPRIDPGTVPEQPGVRVRGYLPDLDQHLAAADLAVVQGGLTTCMELTANQRPFLYVPLRHHFEQTFHVRHRLERYGAGRHLDYDTAADRDALATAILKEIEVEPNYRPVETDGAARAASLLAGLL